ncbi:hypothetical protein [Bacillus sp. SRB_331]|jgi:hypothetical protein|uniref:hypothetical protein n=1 Tax=Bacillus sp. SRB_331 TaxID=1969379 RepID=UPI0015EC987A|nr:hypothetical protein [Bacillus sp. SRB_331]
MKAKRLVIFALPIMLLPACIFAEWGNTSTLWFNTDLLELENESSTEELKALFMNSKI